MILAQVINRISEQWDFRSIMILALAGAVGIWILSVFQALAEKEVTVRSQNISYSFGDPRQVLTHLRPYAPCFQPHSH